MSLKNIVTPDTIVGELLRYTQAERGQEQVFSHVKSEDGLLPALRDNALRVLGSFEKYEPLQYDVWEYGKREVAIVMGYSGDTSSDSPGYEHYLAMRAVSFEEFEKDDKLATRIKDEIHDARREYGCQFERYYLLLCTDGQKHRGQIEVIRKGLREEAIVSLVEPADAWSFYTIDDTTIDAASDRLIYGDDYVRRQAGEQIANIDKRQLILLLSCLVHAIEEMKNFSVADEFVIHNDHLHDFEASHRGDYSPQDDVSAMEGKFFFRDADVEGFRIYPDSVSAVIALYHDARVRYGHEGDEAVRYLFAFLERTL